MIERFTTQVSLTRKLTCRTALREIVNGGDQATRQDVFISMLRTCTRRWRLQTLSDVLNDSRTGEGLMLKA